MLVLVTLSYPVLFKDKVQEEPYLTLQRDHQNDFCIEMGSDSLF